MPDGPLGPGVFRVTLVSPFLHFALLETAFTEPLLVFVHAYTGDAAPAVGIPTARAAERVAQSASVDAIAYWYLAIGLRDNGRPLNSWCSSTAVPLDFLVGNRHSLGWA